jgi:hypothetical protein
MVRKQGDTLIVQAAPTCRGWLGFIVDIRVLPATLHAFAVILDVCGDATSRVTQAFTLCMHCTFTQCIQSGINIARRPSYNLPHTTRYHKLVCAATKKNQSLVKQIPVTRYKAVCISTRCSLRG